MTTQAAAEPIAWSAGFPVVAGHMRLGLTEASPETREFWEGVARDELLVKRCRQCGRHLHPRRIGCPDCYRAGVEWVRASGQGTVYSFSTVHRTPAPELQASAPYCVGIVALAEGVHLFTRFLIEQGREPAVGERVILTFRVLENGQKLPVFQCGSAPGTAAP